MEGFQFSLNEEDEISGVEKRIVSLWKANEE